MLLPLLFLQHFQKTLHVLEYLLNHPPESSKQPLRRFTAVRCTLMWCNAATSHAVCHAVASKKCLCTRQKKNILGNTLQPMLMPPTGPAQDVQDNFTFGLNFVSSSTPTQNPSAATIVSTGTMFLVYYGAAPKAPEEEARHRRTKAKALDVPRKQERPGTFSPNVTSCILVILGKNAQKKIISYVMKLKNRVTTGDKFQ